MIIKYFELKKKISPKNNYYLLYGNNIGLIEETIKNDLKPILSSNIYHYDESDIIKNEERFIENNLNKSFFEDKKLLIINRVTDKILKIIEEIIKLKIEDISIILISGILEKKSKIRNFFEKNTNTICVPFYEDTNQSLIFLAQKFLKEKNIRISQENVNLIIERSKGDRINLKNELMKIQSFATSKNNIDTSDILKLTNLAENYSVSELVDNCLIKNKKKTINILNENNFDNNDCILIIRIFLSKLKRLLKLQFEIKKNIKIDDALSSFKPPIFWKEKETVKQQLKIMSYQKIQELIIKTNEIELLIKKSPQLSLNILSDYIIGNIKEINNSI